MQRLVYSLVIVALLGAALVRAFDEKAAMAKFMEAGEKCKGEVGASDGDMENAIKHEPSTTHEGKCLRACVMKSFHIMDDNGKLDVDAGREKAKQYTGDNPEKLKLAIEIGDICAALTVPADHCDAAEAYSMCFSTEAKKRGLK
ncbi:general odorant-binding protein 28a [Drosophila grimshawi]|uniref:GH10975 n=1 Tax=Drosophila grimshawi TaxID=7222 RepID=B4JBL9_DROGR|nr:general odorant-binding protein 28a [Drosophila grimshawi]EDW02954.1 GH10975 [Drosophila grimshawi]